MSIHELFHETTQRQPADRELFVHDGHIHAYRTDRHSWEDLGVGNEAGIVPELGSVQFELQRGIIVEGTPAFVLQLLLRAFYLFDEPKAREFSDTCFNIFKTCGWRGPIESENEKVSGRIVLSSLGYTANYEVDDLRIVMAQMQDPQFNGWLQFEDEGDVQFQQVSNMRTIRVLKRKEEDGGDSNEAVGPNDGTNEGAD